MSLRIGNHRAAPRSAHCAVKRSLYRPRRTVGSGELGGGPESIIIVHNRETDPPLQRYPRKSMPRVCSSLRSPNPPHLTVLQVRLRLNTIFCLNRTVHSSVSPSEVTERGRSLSLKHVECPPMDRCNCHMFSTERSVGSSNTLACEKRPLQAPSEK